MCICLNYAARRRRGQPGNKKDLVYCSGGFIGILHNPFLSRYCIPGGYRDIRTCSSRIIQPICHIPLSICLYPCCPSIFLYLLLSLHLSVSPVVPLSICISCCPFIYLSLLLSLYLSVSSFVAPSICLFPCCSSIYLSLLLSLYLSVSPVVLPSTCLSLCCPSISVSLPLLSLHLSVSPPAVPPSICISPCCICGNPGWKAGFEYLMV